MGQTVPNISSDDISSSWADGTRRRNAEAGIMTAIHGKVVDSIEHNA